ncbi:MAG: hypothetical protein IJU98_11500 [Synergistaceae bacterium]|nr:hypothetical protein [Synergistaceae bacterium]
MAAENSKGTAKKAPGKPFKKGQSGNPGGRPKADPEAREALKASTKEAVETVIRLLHSESDKVALMAAQTILDRAWGKAVQPQEVQVSGGLDMRAQIHAALLEREARRRNGNDE